MLRVAAKFQQRVFDKAVEDAKLASEGASPKCKKSKVTKKKSKDVLIDGTGTNTTKVEVEV